MARFGVTTTKTTIVIYFSPCYSLHVYHISWRFFFYFLILLNVCLENVFAYVPCLLFLKICFCKLWSYNSAGEMMSIIFSSNPITKPVPSAEVDRSITSIPEIKLALIASALKELGRILNRREYVGYINLSTELVLNLLNCKGWNPKSNSASFEVGVIWTRHIKTDEIPLRI